MDNERFAILDCHQHFFDATRLCYPVFQTRSAGFEALFGLQRPGCTCPRITHATQQD